MDSRKLEDRESPGRIQTAEDVTGKKGNFHILHPFRPAPSDDVDRQKVLVAPESQDPSHRLFFPGTDGKRKPCGICDARRLAAGVQKFRVQNFTGHDPSRRRTNRRSSAQTVPESGVSNPQLALLEREMATRLEPGPTRNVDSTVRQG